MSTILYVVAIIVLTPFLGMLIQGVDRKITARMQGRVGPPILQPAYDIIKLMRKEPIVVNRVQNIYVYLHLVFMVLAMVLLFFRQDGLMLLFILAFSSIALILGGMCVRSPYSRIGSQREIIMMVCYEPILILTIVGFYLVSGSFQIKAIFDANSPILFSLPLIFIGLLMVVAVKFQKSPFDLATSHHAHQEIVKGITTEFAGPMLGIIEIAHCYELVFFLWLVALFWSSSLIMGLLLALGTYIFVIALDNVFARLTIFWMFRFMWSVALGLAMTNIAWLYLWR